MLYPLLKKFVQKDDRLRYKGSSWGQVWCHSFIQSVNHLNSHLSWASLTLFERVCWYPQFEKRKGKRKITQHPYTSQATPSSLKESLNPSGQSDNNLPIVDQVIVLGASVKTLDTLLGWVGLISLTPTHLHHCHYNRYFWALLSDYVEENGWNKQTNRQVRIEITQFEEDHIEFESSMTPLLRHNHVIFHMTPL